LVPLAAATAVIGAAKKAFSSSPLRRIMSDAEVGFTADRKPISCAEMSGLVRTRNGTLEHHDARLDDSFRCPTCRAAQELSETCRRCKCDLRLVQDAVRAYRAHRACCLAALRDGDVVEAFVHASEGARLDPSHESLKLLAVCALLAGDLPAAVSAAQQAA
jgi:hypothetical protein